MLDLFLRKQNCTDCSFTWLRFDHIPARPPPDVLWSIWTHFNRNAFLHALTARISMHALFRMKLCTSGLNVNTTCSKCHNKNRKQSVFRAAFCASVWSPVILSMIQCQQWLWLAYHSPQSALGSVHTKASAIRGNEQGLYCPIAHMTIICNRVISCW